MSLLQPAPLDHYQSLVSAFTEFLEVAIHLILYERDIYPRESFLRTRKYDYPVQQNRHPKVCKWVADAVAAVEEEMLKCTVRQTSVVLYSPRCIPIERYVFSTELFPTVDISEVLVRFVSNEEDLQRSISPDDSRPTTPTPQPSISYDGPTMVDLSHQFAGVLARISTQSSKLGPLPTGCSFTIAIELRDQANRQPTIDKGNTWVPSQTGLQPPTTADNGKQAVPEPRVQGESGLQPPQRPRRGQYQGGDRLAAIRTVEAGPFVMEAWLEMCMDGTERVPGQTSSLDNSETTSHSKRVHFEDETEHGQKSTNHNKGEVGSPGSSGV